MNEYGFEIVAGFQTGRIVVKAWDIEEARQEAAELASDVLGDWPRDEDITLKTVTRWV